MKKNLRLNKVTVSNMKQLTNPSQLAQIKGGSDAFPSEIHECLTKTPGCETNP